MIGVMVYTRSGQKLGKVASFNLDAVTGHLITMEVKPQGLVAGLASEHLLIPWDAIIEMTLEKVMVSDATLKDETGVMVKNPYGVS